jgi:uncharacterized protein YggE
MKNLFFIIAFTLLIGIPVFAQDNKDRPLITVSGQAEVRVPPDEIVFTLSVESIDKDMLIAKGKTDASIREILAISRRNGVKDEDVQTSYISVEPKYNVDDLDYEARRGVKREFVGYQVSKTVVVRLREIPRFDALLSDVLKAGVTRVRNVEFRDSQVRRHRDQARAMAIKAAQEKAKLLAGQIGQTIGPAYSITESSGDYTPRAMTQNVSNVAGMLSDREPDSAIAPGLISITAQVTVSFRLQ